MRLILSQFEIALESVSQLITQSRSCGTKLRWIQSAHSYRNGNQQRLCCSSSTTLSLSFSRYKNLCNHWQAKIHCKALLCTQLSWQVWNPQKYLLNCDLKGNWHWYDAFCWIFKTGHSDHSIWLFWKGCARSSYITSIQDNIYKYTVTKKIWDLTGGFFLSSKNGFDVD
jgi:hypothetical protein